MKSAALGVIFTAALGTALPHVGRSTPTSGFSNINAINESKLPWVDGDTINYGKCLETFGSMLEASPPSGETVNEVCGTETFCETFNPAGLSEDDSKKLEEVYGFANTQACFDAHEQKPAASSQDTKPNAKLPWVDRDTIDYGKCMETYRRMSEASPPSGEAVNKACGTETFCETFNPADWPKQEDEFKKLTEIYGFANTQACFDAHEQKPAASSQDTKPNAKLPWVDGDTINRGKCLETFGSMLEASPPSGETVNEVCGTETFCETFNPALLSEDDSKKLEEVYGFANTQACFTAHEQKPAASE